MPKELQQDHSKSKAHQIKDTFQLLRSHISNSMMIIICAAILILLMIMAQYYYTRNLLSKEVKQRANIELSAQVNMIEHTLESAEATLQDHLWEIQNNLSRPDELFDVTRRLIAANPHLKGGCLSFVPNYYPQKGYFFEPYAQKENGEITVSQIGSEEHDYTQHPAFIDVVKNHRQFWSDPYVYNDGNRDYYLTTFSYPLIDAKGKVAGACGLDIDLSWLNDTLNNVMNYASSFGLMLTQKGELVAGTPTQNSNMEVMEQVARILTDSSKVSNASVNGDSKIIEFTNDKDHRKGYIYYKSLSKDPYWQVAMVAYKDEVLKSVHKMRQRNMLMMLGGLLILFFIINRFARNEKQLQQADLRQARIGGELRVARAIQEEMLPKVSPEILQRPNIDVCGSLKPAKEVGGDIYDSFIRDEKLFFCIGDVSGKGVPAAMVMSVILSLFRMVSSHTSNPAHIVQVLNEELYRNNETNMFVTFFIGVLDLPTGRLRYCNAGHEIPMLIQRKTETKNTEGTTETQQLVKLPVKANLPMGVFNDFQYEMQEEHLTSDSILFLYTDGLTEARNPQNQQFKVGNIMKTLHSLTTQNEVTAQLVITTMNDAISRFMDKTEQADDLTMLTVRFAQIHEQDKVRESITLQNDIHQISQLNEFVKNNLTKLGLEKSAIRKLQLPIEEIVTNVIDYAYPVGTVGDIKVDMFANEQRLKVVISDEGVAFDPTAVERADTSMAAEDRPLGGLGILLTRELVDSVNYERVDGRNILTLRKKI